MSLTVWCNRKFDPADAERFERAASPHRVAWAKSMTASNLVAAASDETLVRECEVAYGQPSPEDVAKSEKLRLILLSSAGYTRYDTDAFRTVCREKDIVVCNASGVYDEPCAQHALAMILATCRQLPQAAASQLSSRGWPYLPLRGASDLLDPQTHVLLVGYGAIARRLAELLVPFRCAITAFRRTVRGDENVCTLPIVELDAHLADADHVVNILPDTAQTRGHFDKARFAWFRRGSRFYNLGRGETVDQAALIDALRSGTLSSAYLDVTTPEPLPPDHPLWTTPNCFITPHTAGGTHDEAGRQIAHFADNLRRFEAGQSLRDRLW